LEEQNEGHMGGNFKTWGAGPETRQLRRGQGETNDRLEHLITVMEAALAAQERTNQLLEWLGTDVLSRPSAGA
jgi:hypothetical protein